MSTPQTAPSGKEGGARGAAVEVVGVLRAAGHVAYFAGGCVRDELLGLEPTDYDVATDATPQRISALFRRTSEVGASFGVVLVKLRGSSVEVATFRSEGPYSDRRRPDSVTFSDPRSDALRRDFTINALFLDPLDPGAGGRGRVIDYVGGLPDLERRLLRAVGEPERRLAEDHLRALRGVRLAARLGFEIDPTTAAAMRAHASELAGVSRERIGEEMRMMLGHRMRGRAVALLHELGLDGPVLGEPARPSEAGRLVGLLGDLGEPVPFATTLAAWAIGRAGDPGTVAASGLIARWRSALCLSNEETESLRHVLTGAALLERAWANAGVAAQKRAAGARWFVESLCLVRVRDAVAAAGIEQRVAELAARPPGISPAPLVTGDDLIAQGLSPGPMFKTILDRVYDSQLEGQVSSKAEALAAAVNLARGLAV